MLAAVDSHVSIVYTGKGWDLVVRVAVSKLLKQMQFFRSGDILFLSVER